MNFWEKDFRKEFKEKDFKKGGQKIIVQENNSFCFWYFQKMILGEGFRRRILEKNLRKRSQADSVIGGLRPPPARRAAIIKNIIPIFVRIIFYNHTIQTYKTRNEQDIDFLVCMVSLMFSHKGFKKKDCKKINPFCFLGFWEKDFQKRIQEQNLGEGFQKRILEKGITKKNCARK